MLLKKDTQTSLPLLQKRNHLIHILEVLPRKLNDHMKIIDVSDHSDATHWSADSKTQQQKDHCN
ncbi:hypothetical protein ACB092_08G077500 [Castanea dentata]